MNRYSCNVAVGILCCMIVVESGCKKEDWHSQPLPGEIVIEQDSIDFGQVVIPKSVSRRIWIENRSRVTATLVATKSTCGCTIGSLRPEVLQAGERGIVDIVFDADMPGKRAQRIAWEFDLAGQQVRKAVDIVVVGMSPVEAVPAQLDMTTGNIGDTGDGILRINDDAVSIIDIKSTMPEIEAAWKLAPNSRDIPYSVRVGRTMPSGHSLGEIDVIYSKGGSAHTLVIPVRAHIQRDIILSDSIVQMGMLEPNKQKCQGITLKTRSGKPFCITGASSTSDMIVVSYDPNISSNSHQVSIVWEGGRADMSPLRACVELQTTLNDDDKCRFQVRGVFLNGGTVDASR